MDTYRLEIQCNLSLENNVAIEVFKGLETSIPCVNCKRIHRTIIFEDIGKRGICTPSSKCNGFLGTLINIQVEVQLSKHKILYIIDFEYAPFIDKKYHTESHFKLKWARIHFNLKCPKCGGSTRVSTQDNIVRPFTRECDCKFKLLEEKENPFVYFLYKTI